MAFEFAPPPPEEPNKFGTGFKRAIEYIRTYIRTFPEKLQAERESAKTPSGQPKKPERNFEALYIPPSELDADSGIHEDLAAWQHGQEDEAGEAYDRLANKPKDEE